MFKAPVTEIRPQKDLLDLGLDDVWRFRESLANLVIRDVKVLYRQAVLGVAWAVLQPLFTVTIFTIVFGKFASIPSEGVPYPVFAFAAVLPWMYFAEAVRRLWNGTAAGRGADYGRCTFPVLLYRLPQ